MNFSCGSIVTWKVLTIIIMDTIMIDGSNLTCEELMKVYNDCHGKVQIDLSEKSLKAIQKARDTVEEKLKAGEIIYGTNTDISAMKSASAPSDRFAQAAGYAGRWDKHVELYDQMVARVAWVILLNGFAKGTTVVTLDLSKQILKWLNLAWNKNNKIHQLLPDVEKGSSVGFADVVAPTILNVETLAKYEIVNKDKAIKRDYNFASGEVLAMLSSNCFTLAESAVAVEAVEKILNLTEVATALDIEADEANPFIVGEEAEIVAQWQSKKTVIRRLRHLLKNSKLYKKGPSSIHPYVSLRASTDILATAWEALANTKKAVEEIINGHQGNPVIVGPWISGSQDTKTGPVAHFDSTRLFWSISSLVQALGCLAMSLGQRSQYRINKDGFNIPEFFTRRLMVFQEASLRDCMASAQVSNKS